MNMRTLVSRITLSEHARDYAGMAAGAALFGMAYSWFLFPFRVSPGGVGGLSTVLYHYTGISESLWMFGFNIPLFVLGLVFVGKQFGIRSFVGMLMSNFMCWVFEPQHFMFLNSETEKFVFNVAGAGELERLAMFFDGTGELDVLLASLAGSTLLGVGLGLIFRFRGSTGGTDIPVAILKKYLGVSISGGYWIVESLIIVAVGIAFHAPALVVWAYVNLFLTSKMTDLSAEGLPYVKAVTIISSRSDEIRDMIFQKIDRGVTFFKAEGGWDRTPKDAIYVCVHRRQVRLLQLFVQKIDPDAFMVMQDAYDVMGYGFKQRTLNY